MTNKQIDIDINTKDEIIYDFFSDLNEEHLKTVFNDIYDRLDKSIITVDGITYKTATTESLCKTGKVLSLMLTRKFGKGLYFLSNNNGLIKIGISNDVTRRIIELERLTGFDIKLIKFIPKANNLESTLHRKFKKYNEKVNHLDGTSGKEWFKESDELLKYIDNYGKKTV